jgi:hypothetical protein
MTQSIVLCRAACETHLEGLGAARVDAIDGIDAQQGDAEAVQPVLVVGKHQERGH